MKTIKLEQLTVYYTDTRAVVFSPYRSYYTVSTDGTTKAIDLLVDVLFNRRDTESAWSNSNAVLTLESYTRCFEDTMPIINIGKAA